MLVDESMQTGLEMERRAFQEKVVKEGMELLKKQKEFAKMKKLKEQKEMREMLDKYWPWGRASDAKPRGLRNLRLEELFPNEDYAKFKAKRLVGTLDLGRGGGGAPMYSSGKKVTRTHEDPTLRFQFGSKDLRRCVDNIMRYKTDKESQQEYKKQLDKLVDEKKLKEAKDKKETKQFHQEQFLKSPPWGKRGPGGMPWRNPNAIGLNFSKSLGWSTEDTLKGLNSEGTKNGSQESGTIEMNRRSKWFPSNRVKLDPIPSPRKTFIPVGKNRKLSPLSNNKDDGVELVTILAKSRKYPLRIPLCSSDVTSEHKQGSIWSRQGSAYLKELAQQIIYKQQKLKEMKVKETEHVQRHFSTLEGFWGRPGHGAPLPEIKKRSLDRLLYPQMFPIAVH